MLARLDKFEYNGPGWVDWLASFCTSILIALEVNARGARDMVQSGVSYYFREPGVATIHTVAVSLNITFLICAVIWLVTAYKKQAQGMMTIIAIAALALCWWELVYALQVQKGTVFILPELPFRPINNLGIAGAQVYGSYLIFKLPHANLKTVPAFLVKVGLCICLWVFQAVVWQTFFVPH